MKKRGFILKFVSLLSPVLAIAAVCVFLFLWHTVGFPRTGGRTTRVTVRTSHADAATFHKCIPNLVTDVFASLKLSPRAIRKPRSDTPDSTGISTYTIFVPYGESLTQLHMKLADAACDSGGMVYSAVETLEGDQLTLNLGASGRITDAVVLKKTAGRKSADVRAAIVILDAGECDVSVLKGLLQMDVRVTFAIRPSSRYASRAAKLAKERGTPVIVYLPSGADGSKTPENERMVPSEPDAVIVKKLEKSFEALPDAEGIMVSVESRSDDDVRGLETIMNTLRSSHRCFIDMLPYARSSGCAVAGRRWVKAAGTEGLIDGVFASSQGRAGLRSLFIAASEHAPSVVACTPDPEVIGLLVRELPVLKSSGIRFVSAVEAAR